MRIVAIDGFDMTIDGRIGLNLYRDGRRPAVQGGRFGPTEAMRNPGGLEQAVVMDRLDGGVGAVERQVPNTYPLAIDGCTRFSRAWTPSGEITDLPTLPPYAGQVPTRIRSMIPYRGCLLVGAGSIIYAVGLPDGDDVPDFTQAVPVGALDETELVADMLEFEGMLCIGSTRLLDGQPGRFYVWDGLTLRRSAAANRQHLWKTYQVINDVGSERLVSNDTPYTFRFVAAMDPSGPSTIYDYLLDDTDTTWAGDNGIYPVGDRSAPITNIGGSALVVFFAKTDGVYHVGPDGRAARIVDWSDSIHPTNGQVFAFAYGGMYCSNFRWGLVRVDVANLQVQWQTNACGPGANLPRVVPSSGQVTALTMDGEWIVVTQFNGADSYIFYGRPTEITERTAMINLAAPQSLNWHGSEGTFWGRQVTQLQAAVLGPNDRPLLWVGWELPGGAPGISNISLPKLGTPLEDHLWQGPHRFQTQSWLYYPRQDWGSDQGGPFSGWASVRKVFNRLELSGEYLERYVTWIDAFMANQGGHWPFWDRALDPENTFWTHVGRFDGGESASLVPGRQVQSGVKASLMLRGFCDRARPFAFYGAKLRGTPILEQNERRQYRVVFGRARKANQAMDHRERLFVLNEMWALQWADPVTLLDQFHIPLVVDIEPNMSYEDTIEPSTGEPTIVLTFSCRIIRRGFYWGAGFRWGTDITWSSPVTPLSPV